MLFDDIKRMFTQRRKNRLSLCVSVCFSLKTLCGLWNICSKAEFQFLLQKFGQAFNIFNCFGLSGERGEKKKQCKSSHRTLIYLLTFWCLLLQESLPCPAFLIFRHENRNLMFSNGGCSTSLRPMHVLICVS